MTLAKIFISFVGGVLFTLATAQLWHEPPRIELQYQTATLMYCPGGGNAVELGEGFGDTMKFPWPSAEVVARLLKKCLPDARHDL